MRAVQTASDTAGAMAAVLKGIRFDESRLSQATSAELFATGRALEMVRMGVPFREAYRRAADAIETIRIPEDPQEAIDTYLVDGYPGRCRPEKVLKRLELAWHR